MSRVPIGSSGRKDFGLGIPIPKSYFPQYEMTSQFEGAERIAEKWGISREDMDAFGFRSQQLAAQARDEGRYESQILPVLDADDHLSGIISIGDVVKATITTLQFERDRLQEYVSS